MNAGPPSDALVFFGISGDLAYKKIFPALHAMARRGALNLPVIGVANSAFTTAQIIERARASVAEFGGGVDEALRQTRGATRVRERRLHGPRDLRAPHDRTR